MNTLSSFLDHLFITLVGTVVGLLVGGTLGYALARLLSHLYFASDRVMTLAVLVPWRTVLAPWLVPFAVPIIAVRILGLGAKTGIASVAVSAVGLATAWASGILIQRQFPRSQRVELIAATRTVTVVGAALLIGFGTFGAGGLGFVAWSRIAILDYGGAFTIYILILAAILVFDLSLGVLQYVVISWEARMASEDSSSHTQT